MAEPTKVMHLRVPEELHARLAEYARRNRRSMTSAAIVLIEQALDAEGSDATEGRV
jgi:predicted HicB family RNase H-like nuclease